MRKHGRGRQRICDHLKNQSSRHTRMMIYILPSCHLSTCSMCPPRLSPPRKTSPNRTSHSWRCRQDKTPGAGALGSLGPLTERQILCCTHTRDPRVVQGWENVSTGVSSAQNSKPQQLPGSTPAGRGALECGQH